MSHNDYSKLNDEEVCVVFELLTMAKDSFDKSIEFYLLAEAAMHEVKEIVDSKEIAN